MGFSKHKKRGAHNNAAPKKTENQHESGGEISVDSHKSSSHAFGSVSAQMTGGDSSQGTASTVSIAPSATGSRSLGFGGGGGSDTGEQDGSGNMNRYGSKKHHYCAILAISCGLLAIGGFGVMSTGSNGVDSSIFLMLEGFSKNELQESILPHLFF